MVDERSDTSEEGDEADKGCERWRWGDEGTMREDDGEGRRGISKGCRVRRVRL